MRSLPEGPVIELSDREEQILHLIAEGRSGLEIGARLFIAHRTVRDHKHTLYKKLGARNSAHAVNLAYQAGLLTPFGDDHETVAEQVAVYRRAQEMGYQLALVPSAGGAG